MNEMNSFRLCVERTSFTHRHTKVCKISQIFELVVATLKEMNLQLGHFANFKVFSVPAMSMNFRYPLHNKICENYLI